MLTPNEGIYLLSMIDHKSTYRLADDLEISISKEFENNLRERNPQLGLVEFIPGDNPLELKVGDVVAVNHFTFFGDIGKNKSFNIQDHTVLEDKKIFKVLPRQIYFKYNNETPEPLKDYILCQEVEIEDTVTYVDGEFKHEKKWKQTSVVTHGDWKGKTILVLPNSFYLVTIGKTDYYKVRKDEVVAFIEYGEIVPINKNIVVEYVPEKEHPFLDLSMVKKPIDVMAKVIKKPVSDEWNEIVGLIVCGITTPEGDYCQVYRNQGVAYKGYRVVSGDMIIFKYEEA